jgi:hypothetical protein
LAVAEIGSETSDWLRGSKTAPKPRVALQTVRLDEADATQLHVKETIKFGVAPKPAAQPKPKAGSGIVVVSKKRKADDSAGGEAVASGSGGRAAASGGGGGGGGAAAASGGLSLMLGDYGSGSSSD